MFKPKISLAIPVHDMKDGPYFIKRLMDSLDVQTFRDFEVVTTKEGKMAENTNVAIKKCKGELIKILYMDDFLAHENSLQEIVDAFKPEDQWLVTGCEHTHDGIKRFNSHYASLDGLLHYGTNTIGSPSVLTIRNKNPLFFDENMTWLLDVDLYKRYYKEYGGPIILNKINVIIGIGDHQMTNILTDQQKLEEADYLFKKK